MTIRLLIILCLSIYFTSSFSQASFEFVLQDSLSSKCISTFLGNQNYYISIGHTTKLDESGNDGLIIKFTDPDNININKIQKQDSSIYLKFGFLLENGNYFCAGIISIENIPALYSLEINSEFEIINEHIFEIPEIYNSLTLHNLLVDSTVIIINGEVDDPNPGLIRHLYVAKLNMQGELLDTLISSEFRADTGSDILIKPDKNGYYLIGSYEFAELIELDSNLNIIGFQWMDPDNDYHGHLGVRWLANGNMIIASLANQEVPGAFYDLRVRLCNTDLEAYKDTVIFDDGKNILPIYSGLDFIDENNIWVVTHSQDGKSTDDWEYGRIYIFDANLNVKAAKYFGGTMDKYLYSIKALEDGGCIITGITPDPEKKGNKDIYIKKVMLNDILTHAEETPDINDQDVLLYPVPFNSEIQIETYRKGLSISLYSIGGYCILDKEKLKVPHTTIQTPGLAKGVYSYSIFDDGKIIQSGKIIKQ